ncbi:NACHT domain-containing protein [Amycolatopsis sp. DG1A-15b]|uniref:NACHT domain-containing protein n=1 Tax=Amycolatopsis sp. DG1A-15b TaxID=3052846 RepID=UPI00255BB60E|nr:NACHT domain-containing protein [Amycolatopsis sp. DG1A-15b]WIX92592.1 NACHT domain-containing protein [Amycolatopsis sp. DG1A-15b]
MTVATAGSVDLFALRDEIVGWSRSIVGRLKEKTSGLSRFDRTQRLTAAHSVIVVLSFYDALEELMQEMPTFNLDQAEITAEEQVALTIDQPVAQRYADMVASLVDDPPPMPAPHLPFEHVLDELQDYFQKISSRVHAFLMGLSAFADKSLGDAAFVIRQRVPTLAIERYQELYRQLMIEVPEFRVWSGMIEAQVARETIRRGFVSLRADLDSLVLLENSTLDSVRNGLTVRHRQKVKRAVLQSSETAPQAILPTLEDSYVSPDGLVAIAGPADLPATEAWWRDRPTVVDVPRFLIGYLTTKMAVEQPLVILGQPGSGKSVLTQVLAADLPDSNFLVVRVELRNIRADSSVQQHIEQTLYQSLGEEVSWPDLVRHAGHSLPVIIMDGFDELLQATGVSRADYLEQLREFQLRESELGRPVAILVTSRTIVADRARFPWGTVVIRLKPFDDDQVESWIRVWNLSNRSSLERRGLKMLSSQTVLQYEELARQPLLLLLLALYDAGANGLQKSSGRIGRVDLYERLFADFVSREVDKHHDGLTPELRNLEIGSEWRRLSAVALAMLNRGGDVIAEADLEADIIHLLTPGDRGLGHASAMRQALTVGQLLVGRFFFIHESQASRGTGNPERSFEFLHATFGEFLAARQIVNALKDLVGDREFTRQRIGMTLDAGYLYSLTSFITVARRAPLWEFCRGFIDRLDSDLRQQIFNLSVELFVDSGYSHPTWSLGAYEPRRKPLAARHATYSANLACFAVLASGGSVDAKDLVGDPVVSRWRSQALLWQSQLDTEDRQRLWQALRVAWDLSSDPTALMVRVEDGSIVRVYESLPWPADARPDGTLGAASLDVSVPSDTAVGRALRRSAFVQTAHEVREHLYALLPYWRICGDSNVWIDDHMLVSNAGSLFDVLLDVPQSKYDTIDRKLLYSAAMRYGNKEQHRLLIAQMVRDSIYFEEEDLAAVLEVIQRGAAVDRSTAQAISILNRMTAGALTRGEIAIAVAAGVRKLEISDMSLLVSALLGLDPHL